MSRNVRKRTLGQVQLSEDLGQPAQFDLNLHWTLCIASGAEVFAYVQQRL